MEKEGKFLSELVSPSQLTLSLSLLPPLFFFQPKSDRVRYLTAAHAYHPHMERSFLSRYTELDFSLFDSSSDPLPWIHRCENFFRQ